MIAEIDDRCHTRSCPSAYESSSCALRRRFPQRGQVPAQTCEAYLALRNPSLPSFHLDPALLHLEITESVVMEHAERACATLNQLRALGVQLSIDDFGTGYSSLSYLARFPINKLKIDRSFIAEMMTSDETLEVVRGIITLASTLKMDVVAEGVETDEQRRILNALNVTYAQGYLFSRPLEAEQVVEYIASKTITPQTVAQPPVQIGIDSAPLQSIAIN